MILRNADCTWKEHVFRLYLTELSIAEGVNKEMEGGKGLGIASPLAEKRSRPSRPPRVSVATIIVILGAQALK